MIEEHNVKEGLYWMGEAANPFGIFETVMNPSGRGIAQTMYYPTIMAGAAAWASALSTMSGQGLNLMRYSVLRADTYRFAVQRAPAVLKGASRAGPAIFGAAVIGGTVYGIKERDYDKTPHASLVNPIIDYFLGDIDLKFGEDQ